MAAAVGEAWGIAVDDSAVFWRDGGGRQPGRVMRVNKDGTQPLQLAATTGEGPRFLALDSTNVYWTSGDSTDGTVMTSAKDGSEQVSLAVSQAGPRGIAVDDFNVYWTNFGGATVMKAPKSHDPARLAHPQPTTSGGAP
jgi:hypothetical protein